MSIRKAVVALSLAILSLPAMAQDVAGKWNGSMATDQGEFSMVFDFTVEGDVLKGTITNDFTGATPITDGKLEGNKLTFNTSFDDGAGGAMTISYTGLLEAGKINLKMGIGGVDAAAAGGFEIPPLTLTRAPE
jgi:hypothetical protein